MSTHMSGDLDEVLALSVALEAEGAAVGRELASQRLGGHLGKGATRVPSAVPLPCREDPPWWTGWHLPSHGPASKERPVSLLIYAGLCSAA